MLRGAGGGPAAAFPSGHGVSAGRECQREIEVKSSLLQVAERIDDGYNISVRVGRFRRLMTTEENADGDDPLPEVSSPSTSAPSKSEPVA